jgi:uncharacterized FlaG/YvyC family protein
MKSLSGLHPGIAPTPPAPSRSSSVREHVPTPVDTTLKTVPPTREELAAAARALQEQLAAMPGGDREVTLLYEEEERVLVVEIRDRDTGRLLQQFPPEILLNQDRQHADLLGTVIDRRI